MEDHCPGYGAKADNKAEDLTMIQSFNVRGHFKMLTEMEWKEKYILMREKEIQKKGGRRFQKSIKNTYYEKKIGMDSIFHESFETLQWTYSQIVKERF